MTVELFPLGNEVNLALWNTALAVLWSRAIP